MFTYLRQPRRIVASEPFPEFPIQCEIELRLAPPQVFGAGQGPIRAIRLGSDFSLLWDANNDRDLSQPKPGFERMQIESAALDGTFVLSGDRLTYSLLAESVENMLRYVQFLQFAVPPALGYRLPNPIHVLQIGGKVGSVPFSVQHSRSVTPIVVLTDDGLRGRIEAGIAMMAFIATEESGRVLAATRYVHVAARLLAAAHSPWEFMAEALLNYAKALEVLFGDSRDEQRQGLRSVGIADSEIEGRYIPVTLLRDMLDVAHPKLSLLDANRLRSLYQFLVGLEGDFSELLASVQASVERGDVQLPSSKKEFRTSDLRTIDKIFAADAARATRTQEGLDGRAGDADR